MIPLCFIDPEREHLIEVPLHLAMINYRVEDGIVLVNEDDVDRAKVTLCRFGNFK